MVSINSTIRGAAVGAAACWLACSTIVADDYDPLRRRSDVKILNETFSVHDTERKRDIPIRVYRTAESTTAPVVLFSHGLGGSRDMGKYLGEHWAARGYTAVFLQHPGSDERVWRDARLGERMQAMRNAASAENLILRVHDVPAVLNQLETWNATSGHALHGALELKRVGMSGHSFGAQTTQFVSGQRAPIARQELADERIEAAIIMSPGAPPLGVARAFGDVKRPWLLMTGTEDVSPIGGQTVESRLSVYPALPAGDKYELVLDQAKHSVFTDREVPGENRNPNHHRVILGVSTAFWDAYLKQDAAAKAWLSGPQPKALMEPRDRWQSK